MSNTLININTRLDIGDNDICIVESFLGGGGQGEVYMISTSKGKFALKWYFKRNQTKFLKNSLKELINRGSPNHTFLWPIQIVEYKGHFGYIMNLRPDNYKKSQKLLDREFSLTYTSVCNAVLSLCDSFRKLHVKGLSYQDISWGNLFIDPINGEILICDNDNVSVHGQGKVGISGTYGFMAPEIVRGDHGPDQYSDLFSLAVLMFQLLFLEHPFNGKRWTKIACWDDFAKKKLYGTEPIFIFDPNNLENRPMPGVQDNAEIFWNMYPDYIKNNFIKVFTKGLIDRENGRLMEEIWMDSFRKLKENIFPCPYCGRENIACENINTVCWGSNCKKKLDNPPKIKISIGKRERYIVLNKDTKLYSYQLEGGGYDENFANKVVGEVTKSPSGKWGIRNLTNYNWNYTIGDIKKQVEPNKAFVLTNNIEIDFGKSKGIIIN
ncbi:MAG: serine/threonine-protein kinase [Defluviitaleaceae bacterium]|nr:serine/threonine-protein kinase [Defluviitaleaceae bacterium]